MPSFYSQRAAQLGLVFEPEESDCVTLDLRFSFSYNRNNLYKRQDTETDIKWDPIEKTDRIDRKVEEINDYLDLHKPESMPQSPVFFDWYDVQWLEQEPAKISEKNGFW